MAWRQGPLTFFFLRLCWGRVLLPDLLLLLPLLLLQDKEYPSAPGVQDGLFPST